MSTNRNCSAQSRNTSTFSVLAYKWISIRVVKRHNYIIFLLQKVDVVQSAWLVSRERDADGESEDCESSVEAVEQRYEKPKHSVKRISWRHNLQLKYRKNKIF